MFKRYILSGCLLAAGVGTLFLSSTIGQAQNRTPRAATTQAKPEVIKLVGFAKTPPASTFPAAGSHNLTIDPELLEKHEINELNTARAHPGLPGPSFDGSIQAQAKTPNHLSDIWTKAVPSSNAPSPATATQLLTFEGIGVQNSAPPDTNADVGPNDIVENVNTLVQVFDKTGAPRGPAFKQSSLYQALGGVCANTDDGDPVVLYDRLADRWLISQFGFLGLNTPPYHECVAISKTPDPMGEYYVYDFELPGTEFPDYPKFGVWPDGYYMTTNQFCLGGNFDGAGAFAFNRAKMLVGDTSGDLGVYFNLSFAPGPCGPGTNPEGVFGMLPSDHDGINPPPPGSPNVFVYFTDNDFGDPADGLRLFNFNFVPDNVLASTFTEPQTSYASPLALLPFDARDPNGRDDIEQPPPAGNNSTDRLDSIGSRLMWRLQYINRNGTESLVGNFTVNVSGVTPNTAATYQAGFRDFELRRNCPGCNYFVNEQFTLVPPGGGGGATGDNAWIGSAAMDNSGNLAVGFSVSGVGTVPIAHNPSQGYAARNFFDAPNNLTESGLLFYGVGVQRGTSNRWGDYSSLMIDPVDDCTFWWANEYYTSNNLTFNWQTRLGAFRMAVCSSPAQGTLSGTITACNSGAPLSLAMVQVSNGMSTTTAATSNGNYSMQLPPGDYTVTIIDPNRKCNLAGPFNVTITNGNTTTLNACLSGVAEPVVDPSDPTLEVITGGNNNGIIDANECNMLTVTAKNIGCAPAIKVTAVLSTSTAGVTITQPNSPYPDMPIDASGANTTPFKVSTAPGFVCGTPIAFTLTISFTGGSQVSTFSLPTCTETQPPKPFNGVLQAGDTSQTGRLGRDGNPGSCAGKPCPGPLTATPHLYDTFSFVNGPNAACVTVALTETTSTVTNPILVKAYVGSYDPTNFCTNYIGDAGGSATNTAMVATVPANATLVVVVEESGNGGFAVPSVYSGTVTGLSAAPVAGPGICKFDTAISTQASPTTTHLGGSITDTATLSTLVPGGPAPTGTITFRLFGPNQSTCGGAVVFTSTKTVSGNGSYTSDPFAPSAPGTYRWIANYSGDAAHNPIAGMCNDANESVVILPAGTSIVGSGCIDVGGCTATFICNVSLLKKGKASGNVDYNDPCAGIRITQVKVNSIVFNGDCATINGTCKLMGSRSKLSFTVVACDIAPPGTDSFSISLSNGYSASGNLTCGSIKFN